MVLLASIAKVTVIKALETASFPTVENWQKMQQSLKNGQPLMNWPGKFSGIFDSWSTLTQQNLKYPSTEFHQNLKYPSTTGFTIIHFPSHNPLDSNSLFYSCLPLPLSVTRSPFKEQGESEMHHLLYHQVFKKTCKGFLLLYLIATTVFFLIKNVLKQRLIIVPQRDK